MRRPNKHIDNRRVELGMQLRDNDDLGGSEQRLLERQVNSLDNLEDDLHRIRSGFSYPWWVDDEDDYA